MMTCNYEVHGSWGNTGWLGSDEYYAFWGKLFAKDLASFFTNKIITDIGAGNGRTWQAALDLGLPVKALHLIDPTLNLSPDLQQKTNVIPHKTLFSEQQQIDSDIIVFKQSIHHLYHSMGMRLFDILKTKRIISFSMPANPDWPMSPNLKTKFTQSYLDINKILINSNKRIINSPAIDFPVEITRDSWCAMLQQRFTSILHDCNDDFIHNEITWANANLPEILQFSDNLECFIFE